MEEINPLEYSTVVWDTSTDQPLVSDMEPEAAATNPALHDDAASTAATLGGRTAIMGHSSPVLPPPAPVANAPAATSASSPASDADIGTLTSFNLVAHRSPYEVSITDPQKHGEGLKEAYVSYLLNTHDLNQTKKYSVRRRFTDFVWLHGQLSVEYPASIVCPLPDKHRMEYITGDRFSAEFVDKRRVSLQRFLNRIIRHPILQKSPDLRRFLTASDWNLDQTKIPKREGIMENLSDAIMNTFSKLKKPDERFVDIKDNVSRLEDNLQALERLYSRVIKKQIDLEHDMADFGAGVTTLGVLETDIADAMTRVGALFYELAKALTECTHHEDVDFTSHIKDYLAYCAAVKYALKVRDHKQLDYEVLAEALTTNQNELDKLRGGSGPSSSGVAPSVPNGGLATASGSSGPAGIASAAGHAIGHFIKEKYEEIKGIDHEKARQDRITKLEAKVAELKSNVEVAREVHVAFSDEIAKEVDYFQAARALDFKEIFSEYADGQVQYFQRSLRLWESIIPELEKISVDD